MAKDAVQSPFHAAQRAAPAEPISLPRASTSLHCTLMNIRYCRCRRSRGKHSQNWPSASGNILEQLRRAAINSAVPARRVAGRGLTAAGRAGK